jgi:hypothetical protein
VCDITSDIESATTDGTAFEFTVFMKLNGRKTGTIFKGTSTDANTLSVLRFSPSGQAVADLNGRASGPVIFHRVGQQRRAARP